MRMSHALVLVSAVALLAACGGESSGADSVAIVGGDANEAAYKEAYAAAWVKSTQGGRGEDPERRAPNEAAQVQCEQPVEQMEGNTSFDPSKRRSKAAGRAPSTGARTRGTRRTLPAAKSKRAA